MRLRFSQNVSLLYHMVTLFEAVQNKVHNIWIPVDLFTLPSVQAVGCSCYHLKDQMFTFSVLFCPFHVSTISIRKHAGLIWPNWKAVSNIQQSRSGLDRLRKVWQCLCGEQLHLHNPVPRMPHTLRAPAPAYWNNREERKQGEIK